MSCCCDGACEGGGTNCCCDGACEGGGTNCCCAGACEGGGTKFCCDGACEKGGSEPKAAAAAAAGATDPDPPAGITRPVRLPTASPKAPWLTRSAGAGGGLFGDTSYADILENLPEGTPTEGLAEAWRPLYPMAGTVE